MLAIWQTDFWTYRTLGYQETSVAKCSHKQQWCRVLVSPPSSQTERTPALQDKPLWAAHPRTFGTTIASMWRRLGERFWRKHLPSALGGEDEVAREPSLERELRDGRRQQLPPPVLGGRRLRHDGSDLECGVGGAGRGQQRVQDRGSHLRCDPNPRMRHWTGRWEFAGGGTWGDPKKTMFFFLAPAAADVAEADLAAQQKKRRSSGGEQRAMIPWIGNLG